jgi:hypothetical protein
MKNRLTRRELSRLKADVNASLARSIAEDRAARRAVTAPAEDAAAASSSKHERRLERSDSFRATGEIP